MEQARISLNKLGEYLQATPQRRKSIVQQAKAPRPFIVTRYELARQIIKEYLQHHLDTDVLNRGISRLDGQQVASEFQAQDQALSIEVLELVQDIDLPDWSDYQISPYTGDNPHLELAGVQVSVEPDLVIQGQYRGKPVVGAIKIHLSKTNILDEAGAKNVATLLRVFAEKHLATEGTAVLPQLCVSIDTFGQQYYTAPKASKRHLGYVKAACEEIGLWWGVV